LLIGHLPIFAEVKKTWAPNPDRFRGIRPAWICISFASTKGYVALKRMLIDNWLGLQELQQKAMICAQNVPSRWKLEVNLVHACQ
jgi:hypothetical protein